MSPLVSAGDTRQQVTISEVLHVRKCDQWSPRDPREHSVGVSCIFAEKGFLGDFRDDPFLGCAPQYSVLLNREDLETNSTV